MMWLVLAVLTAICTSAQDIISKRLTGKVSPYLVSWSWTFFSLPLLIFLALSEGPVALEPGFWPVLLGAGLLLTVSSTFLFKAINVADLSLSVPILSFTPLFLLVTSPLMLGETPSSQGTAGIFLIVAGAYMLFFRNGDGMFSPLQRMLQARGSRYMLIVALLFSIGANLDKVGVRLSSPLVWSMALNSVVALCLGALAVLKVRDPAAQVRANLLPLIVLGVMFALMMWFQMNALRLTLVPYVIAVKRTSIVLSSLFGIMFLGEKGGWRRLIAALVMVAGVFVMAFER